MTGGVLARRNESRNYNYTTLPIIHSLHWPRRKEIYKSYRDSARRLFLVAILPGSGIFFGGSGWLRGCGPTRARGCISASFPLRHSVRVNAIADTASKFDRRNAHGLQHPFILHRSLRVYQWNSIIFPDISQTSSGNRATVRAFALLRDSIIVISPIFSRNKKAIAETAVLYSYCVGNWNWRNTLAIP